MTEKTHPGKWQKIHACTPWKMLEKPHPGNCKKTHIWKMHYPENAQPGKCQNGKCTPQKVAEKAHTGK